jgi:hypothetical protein
MALLLPVADGVADHVQQCLPEAAILRYGEPITTTGSFTRETQAEASRDGTPPVELFDGDRLCDLLLEYRLR